MERPQLVAELDRVLGERVALVCAPAGFGKTWLALEWLRSHRTTAQAWVSVDEHDNDASRLATHLVEALRGAISDPDVATTTVQAAAADADRVLDGMLHALELRSDPYILVLDDAHLIQSPSAVELVERLIATSPPNMRLVLIGRHDPMASLSRLRLSGELVELRADDLRITAEEAATLVATSFDAPVSDAVVEDFRLRTGGWMAAFRLASLAVGSSSDPDEALAALGGGEKVFAEYVMSEVLNKLEPELRRFLLETSILDELCSDSCGAVTGRDGSDAMLARLADGRSFTLEIDRDAGCYQHHDVIRDVLRAELSRTHPDRLPELHRRAGEWFRDHGDVVLAIEHMLAAARPDLASDWLVAASSNFFASAQTETILTLGSAIARSDGVLPLPLLGTIAAATLLARAPDVEIDRALSEFEKRLAVEVSATAASETRWDWPGFVYPFHNDPAEILAVIRAAIANRNGDFETILEQARHIPTESGVVDGIVGRVLTCLERYSEAEGLLRAFVEGQAASRTPARQTQARAAGLLALSWASEGRLTEAQELAQSAEADLTNRRDDVLPVTEVALSLGEVAWERGELDTAAEHVATALTRSSDLGEVAGHSLAAMLRGRIRGSRGGRFTAEAELRQAVAMPHDRIVPPYFAERIAFERATLALQDEDLLGAELAVPDWRDRVAVGAATMREHLLHIRFVIADGQDPTSLLESLPHGCEVTVTHRIQLGLLRSLAAVAAGDETVAVDELAVPLQLAAHTGHRQRFLDEHAALGAVLEAAAARIGVRLFTDGDIPANNIAHVTTKPIELRDAASLAQTRVAFVEPLTFRELEVLRLLPSHRSYREIGAELYVSVNTVKYHVKAIYRKLGAEGRADAVHIAQQNGMVAASA